MSAVSSAAPAAAESGSLDQTEISSLRAGAAQAAGCGSDEVVAASSLAGRLLTGLMSMLTCRRRAPQAKGSPSTSKAYEDLRKCGQALSDNEKASFQKMAWWSQVKTKTGAQVLVLAPRGAGGDTECYIDMWKLLAYAACQMHDRVVKRDEPYAVVWIQFSSHRVWPLTAMAFKRHLHERYSSCLDAVHVVHPSWTVRFLRLALWPFASYEFWDQFECHERVEFLETFMSLNKLELPGDVYAYDKFLDKQADEMSAESAKHMNGRFGMGLFGSGMDAGSDPQSVKYKEQMDDMQRLLQEQGHDKKSD